MYVYCVESFAHIQCNRIVREGGAIWLNPFATVLFCVCSAVAVECFVPVLHGCVWDVCCYVRKKGSSPVSLQLLRGAIWACMRCPCLCLCSFWDMDYVSQLPCVRYYVFVKSSFKHSREECESKRAYVF